MTQHAAAYRPLLPKVLRPRISESRFRTSVFGLLSALDLRVSDFARHVRPTKNVAGCPEQPDVHTPGRFGYGGRLTSRGGCWGNCFFTPATARAHCGAPPLAIATG